MIRTALASVETAFLRAVLSILESQARIIREELEEREQ